MNLLCTFNSNSIRPIHTESRITPEKGWSILRSFVKDVFKGFESSSQMWHLDEKYWLESRSISPSKKMHAYPVELKEKWTQSLMSSFIDFASREFEIGHAKIEEHTSLYLNKEELPRYRAFVSSDGSVFQDGQILEPGKYIFVLTKDDELYVGEKGPTTQGKIQHSSFAQGRPVKSAGSIIIDENKKISNISKHSGHYKPKSVDNLLAYLEEQSFIVDPKILESNGHATKKEEPEKFEIVFHV